MRNLIAYLLLSALLYGAQTMAAGQLWLVTPQSATAVAVGKDTASPLPQQERSVMPPHFLLWCDCPQDDLAQSLQQYLTGLYRQAGVQV